MSKPEKVFKMGAVRASVFANSFSRNGQSLPIRKVVLEVRYRDKAGNWKGTPSLSINDLPKAIAALQQAYEYMLNIQMAHDHTTVDASPGSKDVPRNTQGTVRFLGSERL